MFAASSSPSAIRQAIPERLACTSAPPSSAGVISAEVVSSVSSGLERNSCPCSEPSTTKSVRPAASADAPTTGPSTRLIIGILPLQATSRSSNCPVPASEWTPSWARWPPPSQIPTKGILARSAISTTLEIFRACISPIEPPNTEKSCEKQKTLLPLIEPWPHTTPSPSNGCMCRLNSWLRWVTNVSTSMKESSSSRESSRSRAVPRPSALSASTLARPPPLSACWRRQIRSSESSELPRGGGLTLRGEC